MEQEIKERGWSSPVPGDARAIEDALDSEAASRDPRLHLTFPAPSGTVVPLDGMGAPRERDVSTQSDDMKTAETSTGSRSSAG